jgi:hypothetical protein
MTHGPRFYHQIVGKNYFRADRNRQCATNRQLINKPSIVTNDTRLAISYKNATDLARSEKALLEP